MGSRSGQKGVVINTQERAVSTDINRLQAMAAAAQMELMRYLVNTPNGQDENLDSSFLAEVTTTASPLVGEIVHGLQVIPAVGTLLLGITDGLAMVVNPDTAPNSDDSPYKYVADPVGVSPTSGALAMTANSSGSIRIDVIECQRIDDPAPETDNRDVFNPSTSLFTASTLTKSSASRFQYRVRAGTAGSGFPGTVSGWLPLCVASVPNGTTTNDTITFWDVRPLLVDRVLGPMNTYRSFPVMTTLHHSSSNNGSTNHIVTGIAEVAFARCRLGGILRRGSPGVIADNVDFSDAANQEASLNISAGPGPLYYYFLTPFGLPRWVIYSGPTNTYGGGRFPNGPRGIPLASRASPEHPTGSPQSNIVFPAVFGFAGGLVPAGGDGGICFGATTYVSGVIKQQSTDGGWTHLETPTASVGGSGGSGATTGTFTLNGGTHFPRGAKRLRVTLFVFLKIVSGTEAASYMLPLLSTGLTGTDTQQFSITSCDSRHIYVASGLADALLPFTWNVEINLVDGYPDGATSGYTCTYNLNTSLPTGATLEEGPSLQVTGWKF